MPDARRDPATHPPSPLAGEGARRADEGVRQSEGRHKRAPATPQAHAIRRFAKTMRHEPTLTEAKLWRILRARRFSGFKFRRQVPIGRYIADFVCFEARLIVEADGSQHADSEGDPIRDAWLKAQRFRVRRFWNNDVLLRPLEVTETIWADLAGES